MDVAPVVVADGIVVVPVPVTIGLGGVLTLLALRTRGRERA